MLNIMLMNLRNMPLLTGIKNDCFIRVYFLILDKLTGSDFTIRYSDCSIRAYRWINIIFLIILPIMLALCLMLLVTYYAFNYAGIIGRGLTRVKISSTRVSVDCTKKIAIHSRVSACEHQVRNGLYRIYNKN